MKPLDRFDWNHPRVITARGYERLLHPRLRRRGPQRLASRTQRRRQDHARPEPRPCRPPARQHRALLHVSAALADLLKQESMPAVERRLRKLHRPLAPDPRRDWIPPVRRRGPRICCTPSSVGATKRRHHDHAPTSPTSSGGPSSRALPASWRSSTASPSTATPSTSTATPGARRSPSPSATPAPSRSPTPPSPRRRPHPRSADPRRRGQIPAAPRVNFLRAPRSHLRGPGWSSSRGFLRGPLQPSVSVLVDVGVLPAVGAPAILRLRLHHQLLKLDPGIPAKARHARPLHQPLALGQVLGEPAGRCFFSYLRLTTWKSRSAFRLSKAR